MTRFLLLLLAAPLMALLSTPVAAAAPDVEVVPPGVEAPTPAAEAATPGAEVAPPSNLTVVSLTFDGTFKSQDTFAQVMATYGMAGTFYVNSGYLDYPAYLSVEQLRGIARNRNEIGGASLLGNDLTKLSESKASKEICDDRATLAQLGFQVTTFAYPYGQASATAKAAVQRCGYNAARRFAGLYESETQCSSCPLSETLPPSDDYRVRTASQSRMIADLEERVMRAESAGGGWVPLVFTKVCVCPTDTKAISPGDFTAFVKWLDQRPETTVVKTVDQVMGGPLKPVRGVPLKRLVDDPSPAIGEREPLSKAPAWSVLGLGIGQAQIIFTGVLVSIAIVLTFRLATRGNRHAQ